MGHHFTMDITKDFLSKINSTRVLVIAGSRAEFEAFVDFALYLNNRMGTWNGYEFVYYINEETVRGIRFDNYFYYGTGANRKDVNEELVRASIKF